MCININFHAKAVVACGKRFHPEHFVCTLCKCPLGAKFYPHEGMPYCRQVTTTSRCSGVRCALASVLGDPLPDCLTFSPINLP